MKRADFEHLIAAAANVVGEDEFVVIGSQAILGTVPEAPERMLMSMEADVYPLRSPERAVEIDGALGDGSQFHTAFGFYAHGVGPETAKPPRGWERRLIRIEIPARVGSQRAPVAYCLEPHDLVLSKCVAGRERDWEFAAEALAAGIVEIGALRDRIADLPVTAESRRTIRTMIEAAAGRVAGSDG